MKIKDLYNLDETIAKSLLEKFEYPWEVLPEIEKFIIELGNSLPKENFNQIAKDVWVAKNAKVAPTASITGPTIIDENTEIRHCAYIRGRVIVGKNAVVGNSTELKNCILFNDVQVPHYNYVGDSILGYRAHMGASSITSNVKADRTNIIIKDEEINTGLEKCGAMLGDNAEIGCGAVLNPGTIIGRNSNVYPLVSVRGTIKENMIYKKEEVCILKK